MVLLAALHLPMTEAENRFKHDCSIIHGVPSFGDSSGFLLNAYAMGQMHAKSKGMRLRMNNLFAGADFFSFGLSVPDE